MLLFEIRHPAGPGGSPPPGGPPGRARRRWLAGCLCGVLLTLGAGAAALDRAGANGIAVLYPDIGEPYRSVFGKIIEGIEDRAGGRVASIAVGANVDPEHVAGALRKNDTRVVIALGRNGLKAAGAVDRSIDVIGGGIIAPLEGDTRSASVLSLAPDPGLLFARLKTLQPAVRRVTVVFDPRHNAWLIRLAREAARQHGLELKALEASDLKSALRLYQEFFSGGAGKGDALWLPQDPTTVEESAVLPLVLKQSWDRNIALFSSSLAHARRGALFSLYPDNLELGRRLALSALGHLGSGAAPPRGVVALREVMAALNIRTASHLGIELDLQQQRSFDLILPEE